MFILTGGKASYKQADGNYGYINKTFAEGNINETTDFLADLKKKGDKIIVCADACHNFEDTCHGFEDAKNYGMKINGMEITASTWLFHFKYKPKK